MVNFLQQLATNLSPRDRERLAIRSILANHPNYYNLSLAERQELRSKALSNSSKVVEEPKASSGKSSSGLPVTLTPITPITSIVEANGIEIPVLANLQQGLGFIEATKVAESLAPAPTPNRVNFKDLLSAKAKAKAEEHIKEIESAIIAEPLVEPIKEVEKIEKHEAFALDIELNERQQLAADFAEAGKSFCFTGAAGTGKTTGCREIAKRLLKKGKLGEHNFKLRGGGYIVRPSIAFVAYTNRAADNMRKALHKDEELERVLDANVLTVHRLLEYEPEFFPREDGSTGMRFIPKRTASNPLHITNLVIEESSMLGLDLWRKLLDALPTGCQIIFVGDINQLQPIFSPSILNHALIQLPVVELTEVYRQALDNPIIANAHHCLKGEPLVVSKPHFNIVTGKLKAIPSEGFCVNALVNSLKKWYEDTTIMGDGSKNYDPELDIILCPYGKENKDRGSQANTTVINNYIAQFLGAKRGAMVYEVIASMKKLYIAEGDRVMIDKQDGIITKISHNANYVGQMPKPASTELTRFGIRLLGSSSQKDEDFDLMMEGYESLSVDNIPDEQDEKKKLQASHVVDILLDNGRTETLSTAGDFGDSVFSLGYALTIHKAQGCEWRKVFILLHKNHAQMLTNELLYTAMTRAREFCSIIDLCNQLDKGIATRRIKGNSIQEKIEWFNSEVSLNEPVQILP